MKDYFSDVMQALTHGRYKKILDAGISVYKTSKDFFQYFNTFADDIMYQGKGLHGILEYINRDVKRARVNARNFKRSWECLEDAIFGLSYDTIPACSPAGSQISSAGSADSVKSVVHPAAELTISPASSVNFASPGNYSPAESSVIRVSSADSASCVSSPASVKNSNAPDSIIIGFKNTERFNDRKRSNAKSLEQILPERSSQTIMPSSAHNERYYDKGNFESLRTDRFSEMLSDDTQDALLQNYSKDQLNSIITKKNRYFGGNYHGLETALRDSGQYVSEMPIDFTLKVIMKAKSENKKYQDLNTLYFDAKLATDDMKNEIMDSYMHSSLSLTQIGIDLEQKYGMHISSSTISRHARNYINSKYSGYGVTINNRKDARNFAHIFRNDFSAERAQNCLILNTVNC
jgi:hypothetical protein